MVRGEIKRYLQEGVSRGFKVDVLKKHLVESGFSEHDVNEAVWEFENAAPHTSAQSASVKQPQTAHDSSKQHSSNEAQKTVKADAKVVVKDLSRRGSLHHGDAPGFFETVALSFSRPLRVFEKTSSQGINPVLFYYCKLLLLPLIILSTMGILMSSEAISFLTDTVRSLSPKLEVVSLFEVSPLVAAFIIVLTTIFLLYVVSPLFLFAVAGVLHLFVLLCRHSKGYAASFRAIIYTLTPVLVLFWLPIIPVAGWYLLYALLAYLLIIVWLGIAIAHHTSKLRAFFILLIPTVLVTAIAASLYFFL